MSSGRAIAKNAAWLMMATTGQKLIAFFAFTAAARITGREITGEYFFAVAVTSTFVILADVGMTPVVIRAIASGADEGKRLLGAALRLKMGLIPLAMLVSLAYVATTGATTAVITATVIACFVMGADALHLLFYGALRGSQRLQYEAAGMFVGQALTAITAISAATLGWGAPGLVAALLLGSVWNVAWASIQTRRQGLVPLRPSKGDIRSLIRQAIPFALAGIFVKIYSYLDTFMLEAFHGTDSVGTYSVAYKVTYAFQFIPLVFTAALFPAMSSVHANGDKEKLRSVFSGSLRLMAIIGAPIAAGISAISPRFIPIAFDIDFLSSIPALAILSWVLLPIFLDFPIGSLLNATHRAHLKTGAMGATMVLNAILNVLLVPRMGPVGAAWAAVVSFWFLMGVGMWFTWKDLPGWKWTASLLLRAGIVAAAVWFAVRIPGEAMPFVLAIIFGGAVGVTALLVTRLLTFQDFKMVFQWFEKRIKGPDPIDEGAHG